MKKTFLILFTFISLIVHSAIFYVSPSGNDTTGNGSIDTPYRSIYKSASLSVSGDTIKCSSGNYLENREVILPIGVSIKGAGIGNTKFYTNYSIGTNSFTEGLITLHSPTINTQGNQVIEGIAFYGNNTAYNAISVYYRGGITVKNCYFENFLCRAVTFYGISYEGYQEPSVYVSGNKFNNNTVYNCGSYTISYSAGLYFFGQENIEVIGNKMSNFKGDLLGIKCIYSSTNRKVNISNNSFRTIGRTAGNYNFCVEIRWNFGEFRFSNNQTVGVVDLCYLFKQYTEYGAKIDNNIFGPNTRDTIIERGLEIEGDMSGVRINDNIFKNTNKGLISSGNVPTSMIADSVSVYFNLFDEIGTPNTRYTGGAIIMGGSTSFPNSPIWVWEIMNNTFKSSGSTVAPIWISVKGEYNFRIWNNIFYDYDYSWFYAEKTAGQNMYITLNVSNNCMYSNGNNNNPLLINCSLSESGIYTANYSNPLFLNTTDYKLSSNSACRNTAIPWHGRTDIGYKDYVIENPVVASVAQINSYSVTSSISLTLNGNVPYDGGGTITEKGFVINTTGNPTTSDIKFNVSSGLGIFDKTVVGLLPGKKYYIKAYSINEYGTSYSTEVNLTTKFSSKMVYTGKVLKYNGKILKY